MRNSRYKIFRPGRRWCTSPSARPSGLIWPSCLALLLLNTSVGCFHDLDKVVPQEVGADQASIKGLPAVDGAPEVGLDLRMRDLDQGSSCEDHTLEGNDAFFEAKKVEPASGSVCNRLEGLKNKLDIKYIGLGREEESVSSLASMDGDQVSACVQLKLHGEHLLKQLTLTARNANGACTANCSTQELQCPVTSLLIFRSLKNSLDSFTFVGRVELTGDFKDYPVPVSAPARFLRLCRDDGLITDANIRIDYISYTHSVCPADIQ